MIEKLLILSELFDGWLGDKDQLRARRPRLRRYRERNRFFPATAGSENALQSLAAQLGLPPLVGWDFIDSAVGIVAAIRSAMPPDGRAVLKTLEHLLQDLTNGSPSTLHMSPQLSCEIGEV